MSKTLYIFSSGELKRHQNTICFISTEHKKHYFPITNIADVFVFGEVSLNKRVLELLTQNKIPVHFFNNNGYYIGTFYPREFLNSGYVILKQAEHYLNYNKRLRLARKIASGSISNILKVLMYYRNRIGNDLDKFIATIRTFADSLDSCKTTEELMGIEGNARETYYKSFDLILKSEEFSFNKRTKRPPLNRLNALISFGNSFLYAVCLSEIYKTHLDPRIGFLHTSNFRSFSLNLDIAEIFKPIIVDRAIFSVLNKRIIKSSHFYNKAKGIILNETGKKLFVTALEERLNSTIKHKKLKRNVSYRTLIRMEAYKIEKHLLNDEEYEPFVSRW